jgi:predicted nucleic acid-binding protein
VSDCSDWEDNRVLDLVVEVGALLVVSAGVRQIGSAGVRQIGSADADLTSMSPWRGTPILHPREFVAKVDAMRRHRRR